jgi:hypothetical protein
MINTSSASAWTVSLTDAMLAQNKIELSDPQTLALVEPMLPYIYLPESDFMQYQTLIE